MHRSTAFFPFVLASALSASLRGEEALVPPLPASKIADFTLRDFRGKEHSLGDLQKKKIVAVVFFGTECPLAKLYGPRLAALEKEFRSGGVAFLGVDSNQQDTLEKIRRYARIHGITFPLLKDPGGEVAKAFGAERTPETFLLDEERTVRYRGRIDDRYGVGYSRDRTGREHLREAIEELLSGKEVTVPFVEAVGCYIGLPTKRIPKGDITYSEHIAPIFNARCVECHREGEIAPFPLTSYENTSGWEATIREVIEQGRMPPWHASPEYGSFANDARLIDDEKDLIFAWIDNGAPEGDPADLPPPREFAEGWRIPEPDAVITMPEPMDVPAEGVVPYRYVTVDPGWTEGKWIRCAEARPGARSVVHHIILFYLAPGERRRREELALRNSIGAMAPGMPPAIYPEGMAKFVPPHSKLVFQLHYTPNGSPQKDQSSVGLVFADPEDVKQEVETRLAANYRLRIPPGAANHRVEASYYFRRNALLFSLFPHMHLRGKSFRFALVTPDLEREIILDVPRYDFNWQNVYFLSEPLFVPEGSILECIAHYDNSGENPVNPDPSATVRWGDQTWDEMMIGSFDLVFVDRRPQGGGGTEAPAEGERSE